MPASNKNIQSSYRALFGEGKQINRPGYEVIKDLAELCCATKNIYSSDPLLMARNAGRREVLEHIMKYIKMDYEDRFDLVDSAQVHSQNTKPDYLL